MRRLRPLSDSPRNVALHGHFGASAPRSFAGACCGWSDGRRRDAPGAGRRGRRRGFLLIVWICTAAIAATWSTRPAWGGDPPQPSAAQIRQLLASGDVETAAEQILQWDEAADEDLSPLLIQVARSGTGKLEPALVADLYERAGKSLAREQATADNVDRRTLVRSLLVVHHFDLGQHETAAELLREALEETSDAAEHLAPQRRQQLLDLAIKNAWTALREGHPERAENLYHRIDQLGERPGWEKVVAKQQAVTLLGLGWATAMQTDRREQAAERLLRFTDAFPDHADAPSATAMRIRCLRDSAQTEAADSAFTTLLSRWPVAPPAQALVSETLAGETSELSSAVRAALEQWIVQDGGAEQWPATLLRRSLLFAGSKLPPPRFDLLLRRLASQDTSGQETAVLLHESEQYERAGIAEQIAATLISGDLQGATSMSREAACRWAGRTGRWSMLALAAESTAVDHAADNRTLHVERLFAEALTRNGRGKQALRWWSHVVDQGGADDFATLLRCAESAIAHGELTQASARLERVRVALRESGNAPDSSQAMLVDLLAADLAIRQVDFREARRLLEKVVTSPSATASLRSRAQWMIGETHFMQRQFPDAIDSYRKVEGLDPGGEFAAASLIQAGKAFEQLGLTREAGDCYSALLGRFADSAHAHEARRRLAALPNSPDRPRLQR